ncbi:MAG: hypothetical protein GXP31_09395 [Kiritimatiellaeota bacterium]|nr:hypothetical protein [Kiritimatiellota bacterium]
MRTLAAVLAGALLCGIVTGCREFVPSAGPGRDGRKRWQVSPRLGLDSDRRPNRRRDELAAVICVYSRYPWYMAELTPWRDSIPLLRQSMCDTLGIRPENVWTYADPGADDLEGIIDRCAREFKDKRVIFYLAAHLRKNGRLLTAGGRFLRLAELMRRIDAASSIRIFILDACYAASAERYGPFRKDLTRWYAAGEGRPAQAFDRGFRSARAERFFARVFGVNKARIDSRSFFALTLAGALRKAVSQADAQPVTAASVAEELHNLAVEFRRQTRITRVPVPVCVAGSAVDPILYEPGAAPLPE